MGTHLKLIDNFIPQSLYLWCWCYSTFIFHRSKLHTAKHRKHFQWDECRPLLNPLRRVEIDGVLHLKAGMMVPPFSFQLWNYTAMWRKKSLLITLQCLKRWMCNTYCTKSRHHTHGQLVSLKRMFLHIITCSLLKSRRAQSLLEKKLS